jgi:hypothetical protein
MKAFSALYRLYMEVGCHVKSEERGAVIKYAWMFHSSFSTYNSPGSNAVLSVTLCVVRETSSLL